MSSKVKNYEKTLNNQFSLNVERVDEVPGISQWSISKIFSPRSYYSKFSVIKGFEEELEGKDLF